MQKIKIDDFYIGEKEPLTIISGPCVIEDREHTFQCARFLKDLLKGYPFSFIFKASFDKANRSSIDSFRGPGIEEGLNILAAIKSELGVPVVTDIHLPEQAEKAAKVVDMVQIPAFLCRQTDLLIAAGETNKPINIKKGQFVAPHDMIHAVKKVESTGNKNILLTDRGTTFGYNNLVSDMRAIPIMQSFGYPVCFDASHSVQMPGGLGALSGGESKFIPTLAKAAIAAGANVLFIESHPDPKHAKGDPATVMLFEDLKKLLDDLVDLYAAVNKK